MASLWQMVESLCRCAQDRNIKYHFPQYSHSEGTHDAAIYIFWV